MSFLIVPNAVRDAINTRLDKAILDCPEAVKDREFLYGQLLAYFDEHGGVPDFTLAKEKSVVVQDDEDYEERKMRDKAHQCSAFIDGRCSVCGKPPEWPQQL